ncbi:MAG: flagellar basal-body rod protein FlgF [Micavibrio sp.]|nr:flagellar basal-body rod protein FlgF [Micavibrio sp.]HCK32135.1 flagellar basal-body rod protein FlgF [Rhodospirillaceae bacterium]
MENASYIALSRQVSVARNLDIVANNIANASTTGFKAHGVLFEEYLQKNPNADFKDFEMVNDYGEYTNTSVGPIKNTGNPLDVALDGKGFMRVETEAGPRYIRNGELQLNAAGEIVTPQGYPVSSPTNAALSVPPGTKEIKITTDGSVHADGAVVGQIGVWEFDNMQDVVQMGNNLFSAEVEPVAAQETDVIQGALEGSNVNPIVELTKMIELSRNYTGAQRILNDEHERIRRAIQTISGKS